MERALRTLAAAAMIAVVACGEGSGGGGSGDASQGAIVRAQLGGSLAGDYARIRGHRAVAADPSYPCLSDVDVCVPLTPGGESAAIQNLCPSVDTPAATWSFSYGLFTDAGCSNELANTSCAPDAEVSLVKGDNALTVECRTRNSDGEFEFCVVDPITGAGRENCPAESRRMLVLAPTVEPHAPNVAKAATLRAIEELGFIPVVKSAEEWKTMTTADFASYRAIVLADPLNRLDGTSISFDGQEFAAADDTTDVWGPAVTGNVIVIAGDPTFGADNLSQPGAYKLIKDGINFAAWKPHQPGLYLGLAASLTFIRPEPLPIPALSFFGTFLCGGPGGEGTITGTAEALADLTDADIDWAHPPFWEDIFTMPAGFEAFVTLKGVDPAVGPWLIVARGLD